MSATSHAPTSVVLADADLCLDVSLTVIVVGERVMDVDGSDGQRRAPGNVEVVRQPDVRKRLTHGHGRLQTVDVHQPLRGQKIEPDVVERVADNLVRGGL